ncbi:MAG TPA: HlyD family efflux transporter periplasmic adaptor subunit [Phycisphaerales bacterium]|nr:HlyD family efflux transporter periplasmic adaptor subunit [Phycisphaerales bacterium]
MTSHRKHRSSRGGALPAVVALIVLAGVAGGGWWLYQQREHDSSGSASRTTEIAEATRTSFEVITTASGELQAMDQVEIRSPLENQATIVEIIDEGTIVKEGDTLCVLNTDDLEQMLDSEEGNLESAKAQLFAAQNAYEIQLSDNKSALRDAELKLRLAKLALDQWESGDRVMRLQGLDLNIDEANRELARLEAKAEKNVDLLKEGFISKDQYDQDELALVKARARVETVQLQKQSYINYEQKREREQKESDVKQAEAQLESVKAQNSIKLADKEASRAAAERQVNRTQARVDKLKSQIESATIRAPSGGMVVYGTTIESSRRMWSSEGPLQIGQQVYANQMLFGLPDTSRLVAEVRVHESLAGKIHPGVKARIRVDAVPDVIFGGTVTEIGVLAENGGWRDPNLREYTVKIAVEPNDQGTKLKPSMRCEADLLLDQVNDAIAVPVTALFSEGPVRFVYVPQGNRYKKVPVRTGRFSETMAEILAGIDVGEQVLLREPEAGEVLDTPWDKGQLELVGLTLDEDGNPVRAAPNGTGAATRTSFSPGG